MSYLILLLGLSFGGLVVLGFRIMRKPEYILYTLAVVASVVTLNIHIGGTIYFSRLCMVMFVVVAVMRYAVGSKDGFNWRIGSWVVILFIGTIAAQSISTAVSDHIPAALRQQAIYVSMMLIFVMVLALGVNEYILKKAIHIYLVFAVFHGLLGIYQFIGNFMMWPMYQQYLVGLPVSNPKNLDFSYAHSYRAFGFLTDTNHYAGYLVGAILIAIAASVWNKRAVLPYVVMTVCVVSLVLTFSRSGIIALVVVGLPVIVYIFLISGFAMRTMRAIVTTIVVLLLISIGAWSLVGESVEKYSGEIHMAELMSDRITDTSEGMFEGLSSDQSAYATSTGLHIYTRMLALDAWFSNPIIGVGLGVNESLWYSKRHDEFWGGAHSHHFDALGQTGLLGALLEWIFMWRVGVTMWRGIRISREGSEERSLLIGLLAAYVAVLFGNFLYHYYLNGFVWFLMGCGVALSRVVASKEYCLPVEKDRCMAQWNDIRV